MAAAGEGRERQIPGQHHRQLQSLARLQGATHGQGGAGGIVPAAAPVVVALRQGAISREGPPDLLPIAPGIPAAAAEDLHALASERRFIGDRHTPLAIPFPRIGRRRLAPLQHHTLQPRLADQAVALALTPSNGGHVVVFRAAIVAKVHFSGGIGVGEPATGVAPTHQQRHREGLGGGVVERPHKHRHRIAAALVVARQDGAEGLTAHLGLKHSGVVGGAPGIASGIGTAAGRKPVPRPQGRVVLGPFLGGAAVVPRGWGGQRQGLAGCPIPFKKGELAIGQHAKPVLPPIQVPEVERPIRGPADAAGSQASQGHAVVGAIIQIAGVPHRVGLLPTGSDGMGPAGGGRLPGV